MTSIINGIKTKKISYKISKQYLIVASILIIIWGPIGHVLTLNRYAKESEKVLIEKSLYFINNILPSLDSTKISYFNFLHDDVEISPNQNLETKTFNLVTYSSKLNPNNIKSKYYELKLPISINNTPYTYIVRSPGVDNFTFILNTASLSFLIVLSVTIALLIITRRVCNKLDKDLDEVLDLVKNSDLNESPKFYSSDIHEFARIMEILRIRMDKNIQIYNAQKDFVDNAAHELQSPLSVFQSQLDILIQSDLKESEFKALGIMQENICRLRRLNRNLLLLSKIDHKIYEEEKEISINKLINDNLDFFEEQASNKNIKITKEFNNDLIFSSNFHLVESIVRNLFMNAVVHNITDGNIKIKIYNNSFVFINTGKDEELDIDNLLTHTFKVNTTKGTGLGLSIVKKIIDVNGWKINYQYNEGLHSFEVITAKDKFSSDKYAQNDIRINY